MVDILEQLEAGIENLLRQNSLLREEKKRLLQEKAAWSAERSLLVGEIDRILKRIESIPSEES